MTMATKRKSVRTDANLGGATFSVKVSTPDMKSAHRKMLDVSWKRIARAARRAAQETTLFGKSAISALGRVDSGYMRNKFQATVHTPGSRYLRVHIGWHDWAKPTQYYDFQERGTRRSRISGYGGRKMLITARTPQGREIGRGALQRRGLSEGVGIRPMNMLPGTVEFFRQRFYKHLEAR